MSDLTFLSCTQRKTLLNAIQAANTGEIKETVSPNILLTQNAKKASINECIPVGSEITNGIVSKTGTTIGDLVSINGKNVGIAGSGVVSDAWLNEVQNKTLEAVKSTSQISTSLTYKGMSLAELHEIRVIIYNYHHPASTDDTGSGGSGSTGGTGGTDGTGGTGGTGGSSGSGGTGNTGGSGDSGTVDDGYVSFISKCGGVSFDTVDELFATLPNYGIDTSRGISRADLVKLSQDDIWEDSHYDFFGCLNRIFDVLDVDGTSDGYLSKDELKEFFPDGKIDKNASDYLDRVLIYSEKLNDYYNSLSNKEKVQFAIDKTKEYFEAKGETDLLNALNRLLSQEDYRTTNGTASADDIIFGNLVFSDLGGADSDGMITLGQYRSGYYLVGSGEYTSDGRTSFVTLFGFDSGEDDNAESDLGITINSNNEADFFNKPWYFLVDTLVHELTHATAYQYASKYNPTGGYGSFNIDEIQKIYEDGLITDDEWNSFLSNYAVQIVDYDEEKDETIVLKEDLYPLYMKLMYITTCKWGEYAAYQADADFLDSIGADVLNNFSDLQHCDSYQNYKGIYKNISMTTVGNGDLEQTIIENHVTTSYDPSEPIPDYKWWTNGDNGILA